MLLWTLSSSTQQMDNDLKSLARALGCFLLNPPLTPELIARLAGCLFLAWLSSEQSKDEKKSE